MSNPGNAATQTQAKSENTYADKVDAAIKAVTIDKDSGKQVLPDGLSEDIVYAANAELRRRETQSSFTKAQQELKQKDAELNTVKTFSKPIPKVVLTEEQREELEDLKVSNPDAWRVKTNAYESEAILTADKLHQEQLQTALNANELERRAGVFSTFQTNNPDLKITDDVIDKDIPPRYKKRLEDGEVTFEQFLEDVKTYLSQGKVVQINSLDDEQPNLSKVGGGAKPGQKSIEMDDAASYENEIY